MHIQIPTRHRVTLVRQSLFIAMTAGIAWLGCGAGPEPELVPPPGEILGVWSTDAPNYETRTLEIRKDSIRFGTGPYSEPASYPVIGVERPEAGANGEQVFVIHQRESDGARSKTRITYSGAGKEPSMTAKAKPSLRFANRSEVWKRGTRVGSDE